MGGFDKHGKPTKHIKMAVMFNILEIENGAV